MKNLTPVQTEFEAVVKLHIAPLFKARGFKKKGNNFYKAFPQIGWHFNIQKSQWSSKDHISFTFNCGIFVPEIYLKNFDFEKDIPLFPNEYDCLVRERIGMLFGTHDYWYDLEASTDLEKLKTTIAEHINRYVFPFYEKHTTILQVIDHLLAEKYRNGILFYLLLQYKSRKEAVAFFKEIYFQAKKEQRSPVYLEKLKKMALENKIELD